MKEKEKGKEGVRGVKYINTGMYEYLGANWGRRDNDCNRLHTKRRVPYPATKLAP